MASGKHGCCTDKVCTPETCMELPEGKMCEDCARFSWCAKMGCATPRRTSCDWFPRRFVARVQPYQRKFIEQSQPLVMRTARRRIWMTFRDLQNICGCLRGVTICEHPEKRPNRDGERVCWDAKHCPLWREFKKHNGANQPEREAR